MALRRMMGKAVKGDSSMDIRTAILLGVGALAVGAWTLYNYVVSPT